MKRTVRTFALIAGFVLFAVIARGAGADEILGVWNNQEKTAQIEVFHCGELYCGKIVWLKEPNYPEGSQDGVPGTPKQDHNNPAQGLRSMPVLGLRIVNDMHADGEGKWSGGTVYDPKNGKTYKGKMTLVSPDRLDLRGYVGISLLGRTTTWTR